MPSGRIASHAHKLFRYGALSALFTAVTFLGLALLVGVLDFPAGWANFLIVAATIPPAFELNRRWVWSVPGGRWWRAPEVLPFGAFSLLALLLSTVAVHQTGLAVAGWSRSGRAVAVEGATFASFGSLWLIEYVVLDRVLFRSRPGMGSGAVADDVGDPPRGDSALLGISHTRRGPGVPAMTGAAKETTTRSLRMRPTITWPKVRETLSPEQVAVMDDWYSNFLGEVLPGKYGWIDRFNHTYAAASARRGDKTLEIGPGNGSHLAFEDLATQDYIGLELRHSLSNEIADRYPNAQIVVGDCQAGLDFAAATFDRVLAIHVLEHLDNLPKVLDEVHRVMKPNGRFSVVIPCEGGLGYRLGRRVTVQRSFEKRYSMPYDWMIQYDHVNQAWEVLQELERRFEVDDVRHFPLRIPSVHLNLVIGVTASPRQCPATTSR